MSVIALFSGTYCSAEEIVEKVADRLGYSVATQKLLDNAAKDSGIPVEEIARAMIGSKGFLDSFTRQWERSFVHLRAALAQMLRTDDQIIQGPAIHLIPRSISHVLRVEIVAEHTYRVHEAQKQDNLSKREADTQIEKNNQDIAQWIKQISSVSEVDPSVYDIKIPIPKTSIPEAVDIICENIAKEPLKPTEQSIQAVLDFQLATKVGIALFDRKQYSCDVTASKGIVTVVINRKSTPSGKLARAIQSLRFESAEEEVREICTGINDCVEVNVRPGAGYKRALKTLLVDDEQDYVMTLSERLDMRDIDADVVHDGQQALTYMKTDSPDVMVLDLRMPGMDGFEVLQRIKRDHPHTEVIIVTGHGGEKDRQMAFDYGAFDYMDKPVDISELAEKIREASEKAERSRQEDSQTDNNGETQ